MNAFKFGLKDESLDRGRALANTLDLNGCCKEKWQDLVAEKKLREIIESLEIKTKGINFHQYSLRSLFRLQGDQIGN